MILLSDRIILSTKIHVWRFATERNLFSYKKNYSSSLFVKYWRSLFRSLLRILIVNVGNILQWYHLLPHVIRSILCLFHENHYIISFEVDSFKYRSLDAFKLCVSSLFRSSDISSIISYSIWIKIVSRQMRAWRYQISFSKDMRL